MIETKRPESEIVTHFRKLEPGNEEHEKWFSSIQTKMNRLNIEGAIHVISNMTWTHGENIMVFVSYLVIPPPQGILEKMRPD